MDQSTVPLHLKLQLEAVLDGLLAAALEKGLDALLAFELWELREQVEEAISKDDRELAKEVINSRHGLLERIEQLPSRHPSNLRMNQGSLLLSGY